ncbi:hypothetical protein [Paracoccus denitrificans]|jgi:hypothetical protein|uniref:Uncharacterized protein n=1 Tax=Paracoccus denitrificans (strain Pd 1222) TaxID=318586 RepID=A1B8H1_PARDP|nr:hypothetical protein [Paracoccus denitrificans]ABL71815.1 hypothetical protein Pden_3748 [Paracoccus denitrificans PD1222]MBB4628085.1 hypothetical protein [Paracoccus denitrificans]MCU7429151.1 hypothetical protein [Paracoccus denitrificans]QAR28401.1 hypothetical protein EO213_19040 [Paracoccus denitrificans]UPV96537.1 hypothetical protein M0K93_19130 [Paracoccus denitrificans]
MADDSQTPLQKFQITVEMPAGERISHVIRAADKKAAMARAVIPYPGALVVRLDQLSEVADAPKIVRLRPVDRARREMIGILQRQGYSLADIAEALNITVERALVLMEAA